MKQGKPRRVVLFQHIGVQWSKASRGAPDATSRNRAPEVLDLPVDLPSARWPARYRTSAPEVLPPGDEVRGQNPDVYLHLVHYGEANDFRAPVAEYWTALVSRLPEACTLRLPHSNVPPFAFRGSAGAVEVQFVWSAEVGAPRRNHRHFAERALLVSGQWLQVRYNGRHSAGDSSAWYYEKHVLNIGLADTLIPALFASGPPNYQISDLADLY